MIAGIAHVAIYCRDIERSVDFYSRVLGTTELFTKIKPDGSLWYVYLHAGSRTFLELFPLPEGGKPQEGAAPGVAHICLSVDDIQEAARKVLDEGWQLEGEPRLGGDGNWQVWTVDPDGVRIAREQLGDRVMVGSIVGGGLWCIDTISDWDAFALDLFDRQAFVYDKLHKR